MERLRKRLEIDPISVGPTGFGFRASPPASEEQVIRTEARLQFPLPRILREVFIKVANGGFGPGYGVIGVEGGFTDDQGHNVADIVELYRSGDPEDPSWIWPPNFLPLCHWGCIIYSVADCSPDPSPVYFVDVSSKALDAPMSTIMTFHKPSIESWIDAWIAGEDLWAGFRSGAQLHR